MTIFLSSLVPGPVSNLEVSSTSNTSLEITWQVPAETNGVILSYQVVVRVLTEVVFFMDILPNQELTVPVGSLGT